MVESTLAAIQRQQIEIAVGELLLTSDYYMRTSITERIHHLVAHADPTLDISQFSEAALEELQELNFFHLREGVAFFSHDTFHVFRQLSLQKVEKLER